MVGQQVMQSILQMTFYMGCQGRKGRELKYMSPFEQFITSLARNDEGYESIFSEQLKTLAEKDDLVLALSGSETQLIS